MGKIINLDMELVVQKYEELQSINKTSEFFNVSYGVINRMLIKSGVFHIKIKQTKYPEDNDFLFEEASKYNTKREFRINNSKLHKVSYKRGLLPIMFPNDNSYYYRDIYVFLFHNTNVSYVGLTNNIKKRYKEHTTKKSEKHNPVYDYIQETNEPFEFKILTDSALPSQEAANKEREYIREYSLNGWSLLNSNKGGGLGGSPIWDYNKLKDVALMYQTKVDFRKYNYGAYSTSNRLGIIGDICGHMVKLYPNWTDDELFAEGIKYSTKGEFQKNSKNAYNQSRRRGILEEVCSHMTSPYVKWTFDLLREEAKKYNTKSEFSKNCPGGYDSARDRGILDDICSHMKIMKNNWSIEEIFEISKEYDSIINLRKGNESVYRKAVKLGVSKKLYPKR